MSDEGLRWRMARRSSAHAGIERPHISDALDQQIIGVADSTKDLVVGSSAQGWSVETLFFRTNRGTCTTTRAHRA